MTTIRTDLWTDAWVGRYESVYSLAWKYAHVNMLDGPAFMARFGACLHSGGEEAGRRGQTLPFQDELPHRDPRCRFAACPDVLIAEPWHRICRKCIDHGYISVFHQAAFMDRCAIHDLKLRSTCPTCERALPFAGDFRSWLRHPFHCPWCAQFLGTQTFQPRRLFAKDTIFAAEARYDEIDLWLRRLCDRHGRTMRAACGRGPRWEPPPENIKRDLMGLVMRAIEPAALPAGVLGERARYVASMAFEDEPVLSDRSREQVRGDERERIRIYRAIRRQLRRRIARQPGMGRHKRALRQARESDLKKVAKPIAQFVRWRLTLESVTDGKRNSTDPRLITLSAHAAPLHTRPGYTAPLGIWARFVLGVFPGLKRHPGATAAYPRENTMTPLARRLSVLPNGAGGWYLVHYCDPEFWGAPSVTAS